MRANKIGVVAKDGVVTLTGVASSQEEKDLVSEYATDIEGVRQVWNSMVLTVPATLPMQATGETLDDASINAQAVTALMTHRSTRSVITRVATHHGMVTLTGGPYPSQMRPLSWGRGQASGRRHVFASVALFGDQGGPGAHGS